MVQVLTRLLVQTRLILSLMVILMMLMPLQEALQVNIIIHLQRVGVIILSQILRK